MADYAPKAMAQVMRRLRQQLGRRLVNTVRRWQSVVVRHMREEFRSRGMGRTVFGKKGKGVRPLIKRERVRLGAEGVSAGLRLKGMAALQETGGRTQPHPIKPKLARALAFVSPRPLRVSSGGKSYATQVEHPGSKVPAIPFGERAVRKAEPECLALLRKDGTDYLLKELR